MSMEERRKAFVKVRAAQAAHNLKMRLGYARLKVDHGWQKQNLSEVENLYYHHSRQPRAVRTKSPLPQPDPSTYLYEPPAIPQLMDERRRDSEAEASPQANTGSIRSDFIQEQSPVRRKDRQEDQSTPHRTPGQDGDQNGQEVGDVEETGSGRQTTPSGLPAYMIRPPVTPPLSPAGRGGQPAMPQTPVSLPPSTPLMKQFSSNTGSAAPISNPIASPAGGMKMTYDTFWSSMNSATPISYKPSLSNGTQVPARSGAPMKVATEAVAQGKP